MKKTIIKDISQIVTMNDKREILCNCDILIEENRILDVGCNINVEADTTINGRNHIALPGFINTHHHMYQILTRCLPSVLNAPLFKWLTTLYEIWRELTADGVYLSTKAAVGELLLTGCTSSMDHLYLFPRKISDDIFDAEVNAADEMGIRFFPSRGCMSRGRSKGGLPPDDLVQNEDEILQEFLRIYKKYHDPSKYSMLQIALSPCSPFSVTKELLIESANFARKHGLRLHTHLAETIDEEDYCLKEYKMRPLDFMESVGWLGQDVWFAHGIHFKDDELKKLSKTETGVAHCPTSNMRLISGTAKIREMIDIGVPVGLAVDGSASNDSSNFMREVKMALYLSRTRMNNTPLTHLDVLWLATRGGAELLGRDDLGSIEKNKAADIILYKNNTIDFAGDVHDPVASLIYCGTSDRVDISIVNGKVVVENGKLLNMDEEELREKVNKEAKRMIEVAN